MLDRKKLIHGKGWLLKKSYINESLIDTFYDRIDRLGPRRAIDINKKYAEGAGILDLDKLAIWWSQQVLDWAEFQSIEKITFDLVRNILLDPRLYAADVVTIEPGSNIINPHVDTPHRFPEWNFDQRLLALQLIIPLHDIDSKSGSTGLVDQSQLENYPIDDCYQGKYNQMFLDLVKQPKMPKGSVLCYNARLLHSSMPNPSNRPRKALLIHYCESSIIKPLRSIDNIWSSLVP
jgi:ectoine hydroxylase-related dioxygenase (phytanoyl-CoA dioxygenase family)